MTGLTTVNMTTSSNFDEIQQIHHERGNESTNASSDTSPSKFSQISTNSDNSQVSQILSSLQTTIPQPNISDITPDKYQEVISQYMQSIMSAAANRFQQDPSAAAAFLAQQSALLQTTSPLTSLSSPSKISTNNSIESISMSSSPIPINNSSDNNDAQKQLDTIEFDESPSTLQDMSQKIVTSEIDKLTILDDDKSVNLTNNYSRVDDVVFDEECIKDQNNHSVENDKKVGLEIANPSLSSPENDVQVKGNDKPSECTKKSSVKEDDPHTSELIKKQMNEIDKEISRKSKNKNIRKIGEQELAQLLSSISTEIDENNKSPSFPTYSQSNNMLQNSNVHQLNISHNTSDSSGFSVNSHINTNNSQATLPYSSVAKNIPSVDNLSQKPTLKSLQTSFSPPTNIVQPEHNVFSGATFYSSQGMSFNPQETSNIVSSTSNEQPGIIPFVPSQHTNISGTSSSNMPYSPSMPYFNGQPHHQTMTNSNSSNSINRYNPFLGSPETPNHFQPYPMSHCLQQTSQTQEKNREFYNPLSCSQSSLPSAAPPQLSNITSELAAEILSQLHQNPTLLENIANSAPNSAAQSAASILLQATTSKPSPDGTGNGSSNNNGQLTKLPPPPAAGSKIQTGRSNLITSTHPPTKCSLSHKKKSSQEWEENKNETGGKEKYIRVSDDKENTDRESGIWIIRDRVNNNNDSTEGSGIPSLPSEQDIYATINDDGVAEEEEVETDKLLSKTSTTTTKHSPKMNSYPGHSSHSAKKSASSSSKKEVLIEGVLFRAKYLGSTQLVCDGRPSKSSRMSQAQEAVARVKAPEGEIQPSTEIDLFISTEKIMVLNTDLQRISDTDVRQDILMDHALRTISYIADIGDLVVLMARRMSNSPSLDDSDGTETIKKTPRVICHVFESDEAAFIAQSIGQAFQVAYVEFLRANGIEDPTYLREIDYQEVLNSQELLGEELEMFARKETQKDVIVPKKVGEQLGIVVVESGWGSMLPTVVVANLAPGGAASRSNQLNIGDQIIAINGISLVGLPLAAAQQNIRNAKTSTAVRLTVVSTPPVVEVRIKRPDTKYQLGFSVQNGVICSLLRGGIAERGGIRVGHRIIEINHQSVVAVAHEKIVNILATATGEIHMKTMPTSMFRLLTGQEIPNYI